MMKNFNFVSVVTLLLLSTGCGIQELIPPSPLPTEELFVGIPDTLPTECGPAVYEAVERYTENNPAGTPLSFFSADKQELLGSTTIPEGSPAYRRKIVSKALARVFRRLDPEKTGGTQSVDLLSFPSSVRKYRKRTDLKPRVIIIGSPLIEDREQGKSITKETIPCDGCINDPASSYGSMLNFPEGSTVSWLTPRANYGNGPNHRDQVEHFLRYLLQQKGGPLIRFSSEAEVVFNGTESQWDGEIAPQDDCKGVKKVTKDEPKAVLYDKDGSTRIIAFKPNLVTKIRTPKEGYLLGNKKRILFIVDISGSVIADYQSNDKSHLFRSIVTDVCKKISEIECEQFAVCAFGGWKNHTPRLPRYPHSVFSGFYWADANEENRSLGIQFVKNLEAGGGTPTASALEQALNLEGPMTCLLYSDGVPTIGDGGQPRVLRLAKKLEEHGATINTIGVGALSAESDDFDWTGGEFLAEVANSTGGEYFVIEDELKGD